VRLAAGRLLVIVVAALVGFLLVAQTRRDDRPTQRLEAESEGDLARILAALNRQSDALRDELASLRLELVTLQNSSQRDQAAVDALQAQLRALRVLAGTVPVTGPGITMQVADPEHLVGYEALVDAVQELRDAGAEAIAVDGLRVGVASAFVMSGRTVTLDGQPLEAPYTIEAIGSPDTLEAGVSIPGGAVDAIRSTPGVTVTVTRAPELRLPALQHAPAFDAARPIASS
jgi:uncharacterized protein YlxW (UPF0749 family)